MKKSSFIFSVFVLFFFSGNVFSQFYSTGQDPASVKWKQINTTNFQIIFDQNFQEKAQEVANILEFYYEFAGQSLNHKPRKISVIIHNQTIWSNGYVSWAPKRMELYVTPPQDILPEPWLEHLCLHELRHVVQIDKLNQGITRILSVLFGQQATGMTAGQLPLWYYEGDAVCTETALGHFGRGRSPMFEKNIKTHLLSDEKTYTLDQFIFGSYKSNIPNHYEFGYQLTAYLRDKYDTNSWNLVHNHVARNSYTFIPTPLAFSWGLKKHFGINQKQLFTNALNYIDSIYKEEEKQYNAIQSKSFQLYPIAGYEDYVNPVAVDNNKVITLKKGLGHIPQFVVVEPEGESVIHEPGVLISDDFSYAKSFIVWAEYNPHYRWQNKEYTAIKMVNIITKKERTVISKSRYFSPDISADANKIAVVEVSSTNQYYLTIISSYDGDTIFRVKSENFIQRPKWSPNQQYIYVIELTEEGKRVSRFSLATKIWERVFTATTADIQRVIPHNDYIFFHSTQNGRDEIYLFDPKTRTKYQMSKSESGIVDFCISANGNNIVAAEHSSQGKRLKTIPIERGLWSEQDEKISQNLHFLDVISKQENFNSDQINILKNQYQVKSYSRIANLFNFHSWVPFYFDYSQNTINNFLSDPSQVLNQIHPGVMVLSQNKLSTAESVFSYAYKNGYHYIQSSFIYKGFLPIIELSANYGDLQQYFAPSDTLWKPALSYNDFSYNLSIHLPFYFSAGKMVGGFIPRINVDYHNTYYYNYLEDYYVKGNEFVTSQLLFYMLKRKSQRDIQPKNGLVIDFKLNNTPFEKDLFGYMSNFEGTIYLPGFFSNHGIKINAGYQFQDPVLYLFNSQFDFPYGIEKFRTEKLTKIYANYVFPFAYPDLSLGPILYLKRLRGNVFFNYANNKFRALNNNTIYWANYNLVSYGVELLADYHLLRMIFPLSSGVRIGYENYSGQLFYEAIFGIDINGI